ncbi:MAG: hypothetical protein ACOVOO_06910 [Flavobacteriales bacterium]
MKTTHIIFFYLGLILLSASCKKEDGKSLFLENTYNCRAYYRNTNMAFGEGTAHLLNTDQTGGILSSTFAPIDDKGYFYFDNDIQGNQLYIESEDRIACLNVDNCPTDFNASIGSVYRVDVTPVSWVKFKVIDEIPLSNDTTAIYFFGPEFYGSFPLETIIGEGDSLIRPMEGCINRSFTIQHRVNGVASNAIQTASQWFGAHDTTTVVITY